MSTEDFDDRQTIIHHKSDDNYSMEIGLVGINFSIYLKSNSKKDTLTSMTELGINRLRQIKKLEDKNDL